MAPVSAGQPAVATTRPSATTANAVGVAASSETAPAPSFTRRSVTETGSPATASGPALPSTYRPAGVSAVTAGTSGAAWPHCGHAPAGVSGWVATGPGVAVRPASCTPATATAATVPMLTRPVAVYRAALRRRIWATMCCTWPVIRSATPGPVATQ